VASGGGAWYLSIVRSLEADLLLGEELYREVIVRRLMQARESVWMATANLKEMYVEPPGDLSSSGSRAAAGSTRRKRSGFRSILDVFNELARRKVELRILHAELPSRPFRAAFDRARRLWSGGLELKICPRVHLKTVIVDGAWIYLGSANLTGAGLGAKGKDKRNFEVGFCTEDFEVIDRVSALFQSIWTGGECGACRLREICPDPLDGERPVRRKRG
jgi:phosphatidylserine/phosphatidylglycerophosphate/cardiolipin synthase-like enzyme